VCAEIFVRICVNMQVECVRVRIYTLIVHTWIRGFQFQQVHWGNLFVDGSACQLKCKRVFARNRSRVQHRESSREREREFQRERESFRERERVPERETKATGQRQITE
jgi:hypothetical protein